MTENLYVSVEIRIKKAQTFRAESYDLTALSICMVITFQRGNIEGLPWKNIGKRTNLVLVPLSKQAKYFLKWVFGFCCNSKEHQTLGQKVTYDTHKMQPLKLSVLVL